MYQKGSKRQRCFDRQRSCSVVCQKKKKKYPSDMLELRMMLRGLCFVKVVCQRREEASQETTNTHSLLHQEEVKTHKNQSKIVNKYVEKYGKKHRRTEETAKSEERSAGGSSAGAGIGFMDALMLGRDDDDAHNIGMMLGAHCSLPSTLRPVALLATNSFDGDTWVFPVRSHAGLSGREDVEGSGEEAVQKQNKKTTQKPPVFD